MLPGGEKRAGAGGLAKDVDMWPIRSRMVRTADGTSRLRDLMPPNSTSKPPLQAHQQKACIGAAYGRQTADGRTTAACHYRAGRAALALTCTPAHTQARA
ncbi:hypothetical protein EON67_01515 [archaeon]|nr:MAG: hypothetical protein EON67_01515 [archaeon]